MSHNCLYFLLSTPQTRFARFNKIISITACETKWGQLHREWAPCTMYASLSHKHRTSYRRNKSYIWVQLLFIMYKGFVYICFFFFSNNNICGCSNALVYCRFNIVLICKMSRKYGNLNNFFLIKSEWTCFVYCMAIVNKIYYYYVFFFAILEIFSV